MCFLDPQSAESVLGLLRTTPMDNLAAPHSSRMSGFYRSDDRPLWHGDLMPEVLFRKAVAYISTSIERRLLLVWMAENARCWFPVLAMDVDLICSWQSALLGPLTWTGLDHLPHRLHPTDYLAASKNPGPKQQQRKPSPPNTVPATEQKLHHPHPQPPHYRRIPSPSDHSSPSHGPANNLPPDNATIDIRHQRDQPHAQDTDSHRSPRVDPQDIRLQHTAQISCDFEGENCIEISIGLYPRLHAASTASSSARTPPFVHRLRVYKVYTPLHV